MATPLVMTCGCGCKRVQIDNVKSLVLRRPIAPCVPCYVWLDKAIALSTKPPPREHNWVVSSDGLSAFCDHCNRLVKMKMNWPGVRKPGDPPPEDPRA